MSSRVFDVRTSAGACALCARTFASGEQAFYLTCLGASASGPDSQVEPSRADTNYSTGYRTVAVASSMVGRGRWRRTKTVYAWDQLVCVCTHGTACNLPSCWRRVAVWENMVHTSCARERGYRIPSGETRAERGKRTVGAAHSLAPAVDAPAPDPVAFPARLCVSCRAPLLPRTPGPACSLCERSTPAPVPADLSALAPLANASPAETPAPSGYLQSVRAARERDARDGRTSYYPPVRSDYPDPASRIRAEQETREAARAAKPAPAVVGLDYFCKRFANLDLD